MSASNRSIPEEGIIKIFLIRSLFSSFSSSSSSSSHVSQVQVKYSSPNIRNDAILINDNMQTNIPNIYAIGDVTRKHMTAHAAAYQAEIAINHIIGAKIEPNYFAIPSVIFTDPEIAFVGYTQNQAEKNHDITIGKYPYSALSKAVCDNHTTGFAKIIMENKTKKILGAQIIGQDASSIISETFSPESSFISLSFSIWSRIVLSMMLPMVLPSSKTGS